jgi:hypothetical protein
MSSIDSLAFEPGSLALEIEPAAFASCLKLKLLSLPPRVQILPQNFLDRSYIETVEFEPGSTMVRIAKISFAGHKILRSVCIPQSVEIIDEAAFSGCTALTDVTFESGSKLAVIEESAFSSCRSLPGICIPAMVEMIRKDGFLDCVSLLSIGFESGSRLRELGGISLNCCESIQVPDSVENVDIYARTREEGYAVLYFGRDSRIKSVTLADPPQPKRRRQNHGEVKRCFMRFSESSLARFREDLGDEAEICPNASGGDD